MPLDQGHNYLQTNSSNLQDEQRIKLEQSKNGHLNVAARKRGVEGVNTRSARSKYRMLSPDTKKKAITMAQREGIKKAATLFNAPIKSLKRWLKVGYIRKKGGGRKTKDPNMEKELYEWYWKLTQSKHPITARMVKNKAIELSRCKDFIASKGWLDKFKVRYNLNIVKESTSNREAANVNVASKGTTGMDAVTPKRDVMGDD